MKNASPQQSASHFRRRLAVLLLAPLLLAAAGCSGVEARSTSSDATVAPSVIPSTDVPEQLDAAERALADMTLEQRIASLLILQMPSTDGAALRAFVDRYQLGGVILMGPNIPGGTDQTDLASLAAMTATIRADDEFPPLIAIDQEGGDVVRVGPDPAPGADVLRALPAAATVDSYRARSELLHAAGVSVNFGIVADITGDPSSFIYSRSLGADAAAASARVASAVVGEGDRVVSTLKHFPGHGAAPGDSHHTVPSTSMSLESWRVNEAPPFAAGIDAGAELIMFGHLAYEAVDSAPASLSAEWHRILQDELHFTGLAVTDDMRMLQDSGDPQYADAMVNVVNAFAAGNDLVLSTLPADPSAIGVDIDVMISLVADAVRSGQISAEQIDESALSALRLREMFGKLE